MLPDGQSKVCVVKFVSDSWCCLQTEGEAHQQAVPALCGSRPGDALLCGEGEAEWSGLLLLLRGAALHHPHGGSHRPLVSSYLPGVRRHHSFRPRWGGTNLFVVQLVDPRVFITAGSCQSCIFVSSFLFLSRPDPCDRVQAGR